MIRIITASAADLEPCEYEKLNITCIPLTVMFGEEEYRENVNLSKDQKRSQNGKNTRNEHRARQSHFCGRGR